MTIKIIDLINALNYLINLVIFKNKFKIQKN